MDTASLNGAQKAALVLLQLGREQSAAVLSAMGDEEVEMLMSEVARMGRVPDDVIQAVMDEFLEGTAGNAFSAGGMGFVRDVLTRGLSPDRAEALLERIQDPVQPFGFILGADRRQVITFLSEEHPQTIALVLVHLPPGTAADLLSQLSSDLQGDVARRIIEMERPAPHVARIVETELEKRLTSHGRGRTNTSPAGGIQPLVNILNRATPSTENRVLTLLDDAAPDLSQEVRRHLFVFTDITKLDDRAIQLIMREVLTADLAMALKGASEEVRDKIMHNLSERAATNLAEEIELLGPVRMQQVEEARDIVIKAIRALEEAGSLVVSRGADDLVM